MHPQLKVSWLLFKATFFHFSAGEECFPEWDGLICWPWGSAGKTLAMPCPSYIYDFNHQGMAFRHCNSNGTWAYVHSLNRTWSNYSECLHFLQTEISLRKTHISPLSSYHYLMRFTHLIESNHGLLFLDMKCEPRLCIFKS
uniref:G-protein coupled receptors family 2 profile 1 domain-containing protein n=1 Tax=Laticauda laticaudata TaxID=8630 RepID=A0A8C5SPZ7_LATLA